MKYHTIIVVPHARARFRKLRLSNRQLATISSALLFLLVLSVFTTWSFFTNSIDRDELTQIREENEDLRSVNQSFESTIRQLQNQLNQFEDRTRQLAIVAGIDGLAMTQEPGIGGGTHSSLPTEFDHGSRIEDLSTRADLLDQKLAQVDSQLEERQRWIASTPAVAPVKGVLTSGFGYRADPITGVRSAHWAIDISTSPGKAVQTPADGVVVRSGRIGNLGKAVFISHGYGVTTRYGHLSSIGVEAGQRLKRGDMVGTVGRTGRATGNHLHYQVMVDGQPVNPLAYILDGTSPGS